MVGLAPGQRQWRVLIVEDEPLNRLLLGRLLEEVGFAVAFADNGAGAWRYSANSGRTSFGWTVVCR